MGAPELGNAFAQPHKTSTTGPINTVYLADLPMELGTSAYGMDNIHDALERFVDENPQLGGREHFYHTWGRDRAVHSYALILGAEVKVDEILTGVKEAIASAIRKHPEPIDVAAALQRLSVTAGPRPASIVEVMTLKGPQSTPASP